jgi:hypothetical protein
MPASVCGYACRSLPRVPSRSRSRRRVHHPAAATHKSRSPPHRLRPSSAALGGRSLCLPCTRPTLLPWNSNLTSILVWSIHTQHANQLWTWQSAMAMDRTSGRSARRVLLGSLDILRRVHPVRGPVCASMGGHGNQWTADLCPAWPWTVPLAGNDLVVGAMCNHGRELVSTSSEEAFAC